MNQLKRREFLKYTTASAATAVAGLTPLAGCSKQQYSQNPDLPNILFITADNLGWKDLSCYGNEYVPTPNIDGLARDGVKFTNAFCVSSSCAPSRASFITGQYPHTHGVTALTHLQKTKALSPFHNTLPKMLREKGYNTAIEGKWHVSPYLPTSFYGYNERLSSFMPEGHLIKDTKKTIEFLKRNKDNRFFLQVNYKNSHRDVYGEYHYNPEFMVDPDKIRIPDYMALPDWPEIREDVARYFSQNLGMEKMVGELLNTLDELGIADNTLVMFVSDNGPHYPGMISTLYDRGTAVPLIVRWPEKIKPGTEVEHLVNTIDIMPTLLEAAGISIPEQIEGLSFLNMTQDRNADPSRTEVFTEMTDHVRHIPCRAVRNKKWKYIKNYSDNPFGLDMNNHDDWAHRMCELPNHPWKRPRLPEELYDIVNDPNEANNLAENPGFKKPLAEMRALLKQHMIATADPYLGKPFTRDFNPEDYKKVEPGTKYW